MNRSQFESKAQEILDQQLEIYSALSKNGRLVDEEVSSFKAILEVWMNLRNPKKNVADGVDDKRLDKRVTNEAVLGYAKGTK